MSLFWHHKTNALTAQLKNLEALSADSTELADVHRLRAIKQIVGAMTTASEVDLQQSISADVLRWQFFCRDFSRLIAESDLTEFFTDYGLSGGKNFLPELLERTVFQFLPQYRDPKLFSEICELLISNLDSENEDSHLLAIHKIKSIYEIIDPSHERAQTLKNKILSAAQSAQQILKSRIVVLCNEPLFRNRVPSDQRDAILSITESDRTIDAITQKVSLHIAHVYSDLEHTGVSIELVFLIEKIKENLLRLNTIKQLIAELSSYHAYERTLVQILKSRRKSQTLKSFLSQNLSLISKKIVDRAGHTGEHYIARNVKERFLLFVSSSGGGLLTVATTYFKSSISTMKLPLFIEGILAWFNYSLSFYLMQLTGLTLATKTPAMTAPVLSKRLKEIQEGEFEAEFANEALHIIRSGFWAAFGNVVFVIVGACLADYLKYKYTGTHFFTVEQSEKYIENHHPLFSLTIWYAIFTGGVLWLGSAIGGWFENWFVFRKIPQAISENENMQRFFGDRLTAQFSSWISSGMMAFATNIALGLLLAFTTIWGKFFGIPLDVRHVTLSSGTLAFSFMALTEQTFPLMALILSVLSILLIGALNFVTSFAISLVVAANARDLQLSQYLSRFFVNQTFDACHVGMI
jgi:site-specific recombinase